MNNLLRFVIEMVVLFAIAIYCTIHFNLFGKLWWVALVGVIGFWRIMASMMRAEAQYRKRYKVIDRETGREV